MKSLPAWIAVQKPTSPRSSLNVDAGELEAICLAREIQAAAIVMDDRAGRSAAVQYGLPVVVTLGLLESAAMRGWIDLPQVRDRLQQTNTRLDRKLVAAALERHKARS